MSSAKRPARVYGSACGALVFVAALLACGGCEHRRTDSGAAPSSVAFRERFRLVDSILIESPDSAPLARISGLDVNDRGHILIADASEPSVRVHSSDGRLLFRLGRSGDGPGEYRQPRFLLPGSGDTLVVAEGTGRLHTFVGESFVNSFRLENATFVSSVTRRAHGGYVASSADGRGAAVQFFDADGRQVSSKVVFAGMRAPEVPDDPRWLNFHQVWAAACGERIVAAATLSDTIWIARTADSDWEASSAAFASFRAPRLPAPEATGGPQNAFAWIKAYHVVQGLHCEHERIGVTFVQGVRNFGDPQVYLEHSGSSWQAYEDPSPVLLLRRDTVYALLRPDGEEIWLGKHVRR